MKIPFIKIEGLGNDYIYAEVSHCPKTNLSKFARTISDRHIGVGGDGLIIMRKTGPKSASMRIFNCDGSEAKFCGNGLRGTALYFKSVYKEKGRSFFITTRWNEYRLEIISSVGNSARVKTDLGSPSFSAHNVGFKDGNSLGYEMRVGGSYRMLYCLGMPNPHAVVFVDNFDFDWRKEGREIEKSPVFTDGINVMFTRVDSLSKITVIPWERGAGETMACGSGAAAAVVVSNLLEYTKGKVQVSMPGGTLTTRWNLEDNKVTQEGPTRLAFSGIFNH